MYLPGNRSLTGPSSGTAKLSVYRHDFGLCTENSDNANYENENEFVCLLVA